MAKASDNEFPSVLFAEQASTPTIPGASTVRLFFDTSGTPLLKSVDDAGTVTTHGGAGSDSDAIHDNVAGEIAALTLVTAASGDHVLIEDASDSNNKKRVAASDFLGGGSGASPLTEADAVVVTEASQQAVAATSYATIFDTASGGDEILSGTIVGASPGIRLTIDGTVVINRTAFVDGDDVGGDAMGVVAVPWCIADTSMKLEVYNPSGVSRDYGWRIFRR